MFTPLALEAEERLTQDRRSDYDVTNRVKVSSVAAGVVSFTDEAGLAELGRYLKKRPNKPVTRDLVMALGRNPVAIFDAENLHAVSA